MQVRFYKAVWGMEEPLPETLPNALEKIAGAGFEGFEAPVDMVHGRLSPTEYDLGMVGMLFVLDSDELKQGIDRAHAIGVDKINVHAGKDWWSLEQGAELFESALQMDTEVDLCFETHRGRLLCTPWSTAEYLHRFPELRITADFSHWCCVCESLLEDQRDAINRAIPHVRHIHARVGHEEGPQVPDPRAGLWAAQVEAHCRWWDAVKRQHESRGEDLLTVDPEFGPPNYMWTEPRTGQPLADLWDVCVWMRDHLRERWSL